MSLRHVLCAVDCSAVTDRAFDQALRIAASTKSRLTLLHAVPRDETFNAAAALRRERLGSLKDTARSRGVQVRVVVQQGDAAGVILLHARTRGVDLLVLGTHHRTGLGRLRMGSVAETVAQRAPCPTLVVPERSREGRGAILCAVDLTGEAADIVSVALAAAGVVVESARVDVLHVTRRVPAALPRHGWWLADPGYRRSEEHSATRHLEALMPGDDRGQWRAHVRAGRPASEILSAAATTGAALIVVGMTTRGTVARRLRRSTSVKVMREASCPVLVVPPGGAARSAAALASAA